MRFTVKRIMRTGTFDLHSRLIGGDLEKRLRDWRAQSPPRSYDEIAFALRPEITVSGSTVRRWCIELEIEAAPADSQTQEAS